MTAGTHRVPAIPTGGEFAAMGLVGGAAMVGAELMFGLDRPSLMVLAAVGGVALVFAVRRPAVALVAVVAIEASNLSGVLASYGTMPVFQGSMLVGVLAIGIALRDPVLRGRLNVWTVICAGLAAVFFATQLVAAIGSVDPMASTASLRRTVIDLGFLMVVLLLTQMTARPWAVATTMVTVFAGLSVLTVINEVVFAGTATFGGFSTVTTATGEMVTTLRYGGPLPDSNFWGRHLIMGLPLAAALLTRSLRSDRRLAATGFGLSILSLLAGIYMTQSRGTFLSAGIAIAVWFIASDRSVRKRGLFSLPAAAALVFVPGVGNRLQHMFEEIGSGKASTHIDPSLLGRLAAQQQSVMMWQERPYFGFGPETFPSQVIEFAGRVPLAVRDPAYAAHNIYLSLAAESGLFGLFGWTVMVLGFLAILLLRLSAQRRFPDRVLVAALIAAMIGWSVSSIGLHMSYFRTFAVVLAVVAAVAPAWPVPPDVLRAFRRTVGVWLVATAAGVGIAWAMIAANSPERLRAMQRMTVVPAKPIDGWFAYALDIRSRIEMLPTLGLLMHDDRSPVNIDADTVRGLLTFTVKAETALQARDEVQLGVAWAENRLTESLGYQQYHLEAVGSMQIEPIRDRSTGTVAAGVGAGVLGGLLIGLTVARSSARRHDKNRSLPGSISTEDPTTILETVR